MDDLLNTAPVCAICIPPCRARDGGHGGGVCLYVAAVTAEIFVREQGRRGEGVTLDLP